MFRRDKLMPEDTYLSATEYYSTVRRSMREKADHNKFESQICFCVSIIATLITPLFITLGQDIVWGKGIPAALSVLAAIMTSWLQLRKPQQLWTIYRRAQRELEREKTAFDFRTGIYENPSDLEKLLSLRVSEIIFGVHEKWEALVPQPERKHHATAPAKSDPHKKPD